MSTQPPPPPFISPQMPRHVPQLPDDRVNDTEDRVVWRMVFQLLGVLVVVAVVLWFLLGLLVGWAVRLVPPSWERDLFSPLVSAQLSDMGRGSATDQARLQAVFAQLDPSLLPEGYQIDLHVVAEPEPNAFAMPGGTLVFTSALMNMLESDRGLAFVLAHEIGHLDGRDSIEALGRRVVIGIVAATLFGDTTFEWVVGLGQDLGELGHSRSEEMAADAYAIAMLRASYGDLQGADEFFLDIRQLSILEPPAWLSTHPAVEDRLERLQAEMARDG